MTQISKQSRSFWFRYCRDCGVMLFCNLAHYKKLFCQFLNGLDLVLKTLGFRLDKYLSAQRGDRILSFALNLKHVGQAYESSDTRFFTYNQFLQWIQGCTHEGLVNISNVACRFFFAKVVKVKFWRCVGRCEAYSILLESQSLEAHTLFFCYPQSLK